ncbi:MAG: hypothetical protein JWO69_760 [Thermoleophilia bacterium]|jgi:hypothetical protein|nr:hypothetical protein [Thermoleophilia bacterium]
MTRFAPRFRVALLAAVALALLVPSAALAVPALSSPKPNQTFATSRPTFSWTLPPGTTARALQVGTSALPDATGTLPGAELSTPLEPTQASYRAPFTGQLYAGRWYWNVLSTTAGVNDASEVRTFRIRPRVWKPTLRINNTRNGTKGTLRLKSNTRRVRVNLRVVHGDRTCLNRSFVNVRGRTTLHRWDNYRVFCYPRTNLQPGTRITTTVTIRSAGFVRRAVHRSTVA